MKPQDAFQAMLDGEQADATAETAALAVLASALSPSERPGPDLRFKARLRSELLAAASAMAETEEDAFAAALDRGLAGAPAALRPLVAVASALEPTSLPMPAPAFRFQLRNKLVTQGVAGTSVAERARAKVVELNTRMRRSFKVVAATTMAATMLAGSSATMAAASGALPVDKLYPVKMVKESAELWFEDGTDRGFVHLEHARTRLDEVRGMVDRPVSDQAPYVSTLRKMDQQTISGQTIIFAEFQKKAAPKGVVEQVDRFARQQLIGLAALRERLPAGARPAALESLTVLAKTIQRAETFLSGCDCDAPANALERSPNDAGGSFGCACAAPASGDHDAGNGGSSTTDPGDGSGTTDPGDDDPTPPTDDDEPPVDLPDVEETDADEEAEDLIAQILNELPLQPSEAPVPVPGATVPPVPAGTDGVDQLTDQLGTLSTGL